MRGPHAQSFICRRTTLTRAVITGWWRDGLVRRVRLGHHKYSGVPASLAGVERHGMNINTSCEKCLQEDLRPSTPPPLLV